MKELLQDNGWAGVTIILCLQFVYSVWKDKTASKDKSLDANTEAIKKLNKDMNRYYFGLKYLAGEKWPQVKTFIEDDPQKEH
jgi:hypothetical protein